MPAIAGLLARNGVVYADLRRVVVTTGPGSFTGLRIGLSAARGFEQALGLPVIGVPSLLALSLSATSAPLAVLLDARRPGSIFPAVLPARRGARRAALLPMEEARRRVPAGTAILTSPCIDIAALARATLDPAPSIYPEAAYVRDADAKPQGKFRVERIGAMKFWMGPAGLHIEPAQPKDADTVAKLHAHGFYRGWPREDFAAYISGEGTPLYVAANAKRKIAGFAHAAAPR